MCSTTVPNFYRTKPERGSFPIPKWNIIYTLNIYVYFLYPFITIIEALCYFSIYTNIVLKLNLYMVVENLYIYRRMYNHRYVFVENKFLSFLFQIKLIDDTFLNKILLFVLLWNPFFQIVSSVFDVLHRFLDLFQF